MTPLQRSRRIQAGLAGLGIVGALGASFGIGAATHTGSDAGTAGSGTAPSGSQHRTADSAQSDDSSGSSSGTTHQQTSTPKVTAPSPAPPQATTSGS